MYIALVILLLVFGVAFLVAEMFLLPGFGITGVIGFLCIASSVAVSYIKLSPIYPWAGHVTLAAALILTAVSIYVFIRSHTIENMALDTKIDSEVKLADPGKKINNLKQKAND